MSQKQEAEKQHALVHCASLKCTSLSGSPLCMADPSVSKYPLLQMQLAGKPLLHALDPGMLCNLQCIHMWCRTSQIGPRQRCKSYLLHSWGLSIYLPNRPHHHSTLRSAHRQGFSHAKFDRQRNLSFIMAIQWVFVYLTQTCQVETNYDSADTSKCSVVESA